MEQDFDALTEQLAEVEKRLERVERLVIDMQKALMVNEKAPHIPEWNGESTSIGGRVKSLKDYKYIVPPNTKKND